MYQVKFEKDGETIYGLVNDHMEDDKALGPDKHLVREVVTDDEYVVAVTDLTDIPMDVGRLDMKTMEWVDADEFSTHMNDKLKEAEELSASLPEGVHAGKLFTTFVGDGHAYYVVTAVKGKRCTIDWRGFSLDRWTDQLLGWGGDFDCAMIAPQIHRCEPRKELNKVNN